MRTQCEPNAIKESKVNESKLKENSIPLKSPRGMKIKFKLILMIINHDHLLNLLDKSNYLISFWDKYPNKKSKGQAEKAWLKNKP